MVRNGGGSIVSIASSAAIDGNSGFVYYASKAALLTATKALSREVGVSGIRSNIIAPGILKPKCCQHEGRPLRKLWNLQL